MSLDWKGRLGALWAREAQRMDALLAPTGDALLAAHPPEAISGALRRLLDLGCGAGQMTRQIAARMTAEDRIIGIDVSRDLLAVAESDADEIDWIHADAAAYDYGAPLDGIYTRCGCMFFRDPPAAFRHLRAALRPGAGFYAVVWASPSENPWATLPLKAAEPVLGVENAATPEEGAPGPFGWSSPGIFEPILADAGFSEIAWEKATVSGVIGREAAADPIEEAVATSFAAGPLASRCRELSEGERDKVSDLLRAAFAERVENGAVRLDGAAWVIRAMNR